MRQECQLYFAHLQSCLLLGCNMLLLSMIPEVLIKGGSRKCNAKTGILVTWLVKVQTCLLLKHIFHYIFFTGI